MDDYKPISGSLSKDGLNRYDLDFLETADWVKGLLLKMEEDGKNHVASTAADTPLEQQTPEPLVFSYINKYIYDFTQKPPSEDDVLVTLRVHVSSLGLTPEERHKFLLLTQSMYDPYQDVVTIKPEKNVDQEGESHACKRLKLVRVLDAFLTEAKSPSDKFTDVPLDLRRVKARRAHLAFPEHWKKPRTVAA
ncbi:37S ribosomal protein S24, mitochondrial [Dinochytrium kinnereticum]|nr:37S ribosomal protein S24, mitochondrial [Dinochytrium kinnereticum]